MTNPMMKCGHAANSTHKGQPSCAICCGITPGWNEVDPNPPSIAGRKAKCGCGNFRASDPSLAFFEYLGPGSREEELCKCGYHQVAHDKGVTRCKGFKSKGSSEFDRYYCGCRGWD